MNSETSNYQNFLKSIVKDALESAHEMEIDPQEALENIIECIRDDAITEFEKTQNQQS